MIEIKLTGTDAQEYLDGETTKDRYIEKLLQQMEDIQCAVVPSTASVRVRHDTDLIKGLDIKKPSFANKDIPTTENPATSSITGAYTQDDLKLIYARLQKPATNKDRSLESIAGALGRKPKSVRDKLKNLGVNVVKGMCYKKD